MNEEQIDIGELIEPAPVKFTFDSPGWYVVGALLLLTLLVILYFIWRSYVLNRYRRTAIQFITQLEARTTDHTSRVYEVNMLLKRIALRFRSREAVASLRGDEWVKLLNGSGRKNLFTPDTKHLLQAIYTGSIDEIQSGHFITSARQWIRIHKFSKERRAK